MSDATILVLLARRLTDRLDRVATLLRRVRDGFPLEHPPSIEVCYRPSNGGLALVIHADAAAGPAEALLQRLVHDARPLEVKGVVPPAGDLDRLLRPFDVRFSAGLDATAMVARLEEAAQAAGTAPRLPAGAERRAQPRHAVSLSLTFSTEAEVQEGLALDLSSGGLFLATTAAPTPGSRLRLSLALPIEAERIEIDAEVRHVTTPAQARERGSTAGAGLRFLDTDSDGVLRLESYLVALEQRRRRRVLIADDTTFFRRVVGDLLVEAGYEVVEAADGQEALRRILDELLTLDLLLLDLNMPELDGVQVIDRVRRVGGETELPIVVISGAADDPARAENLRHIGANDFLTKDASPAEILAAVDRWASIKPLDSSPD